MGFTELYLVNPRFPDVLTHPEAIAFASSADDILQNAKIVSSVNEALETCQLVASVSARLREFSPPIQSPRAFASQASSQSQGNIAIIFGNERFGLPNEVVMKSNFLINIPANPDYSSLNLAQAVQLLAYELRLAATDGSPKNGDIGFVGQRASSEALEGMYQHLEQASGDFGVFGSEKP